MKNKFKAKYEYCHIENDKIVITKTPEIEDLVADYAKSINDFFKTLLVFIIFIPIFTALSVVFYYIGNYGLSIYTGIGALFFLIMAFYIILFTSGTPVINRDKIIKVNFKKTLLFNIIEIRYKDFGRIKKRGILLTNNQPEIESALGILLSEKLIEDKNIEYNGKQIDLFSYAVIAILTISLFYLFMNGKIINIKQWTKQSSTIIQNGIYIIIVCMAMLIPIIRNIISSILIKVKNKK